MGHVGSRSDQAFSAGLGGVSDGGAGGWGEGVMGVVTVRPESVPVCVTPVGIDINTQHLSV